MRIERELMRGAGPVAILQLLQSGEKYGYQLIEALEGHSNGVLAMGQSTLYPMLYNLEAKGLIRSTWRDGETGRPRRYYTMTGKGRKHLEAQTKQWQALAEAMEGLGVLPQPGRSAAGEVPA